jgi:hypothetical protein
VNHRLQNAVSVAAILLVFALNFATTLLNNAG